MVQFIEDLFRAQIFYTVLDDGYRKMAADKNRQRGAQVWCDALAKDITDQKVWKRNTQNDITG